MIAVIDIGDGLARIATALRVPVLIAAVVVLVLCAIELGRFLTERWHRARNRHVSLSELTARVLAEPQHASHYAQYAPGPIAAAALTEIAAAPGGGGSGAVERALARYELAVQRRLDRTRLLVRAGPAIGLMGTLIPLIPGLAALGAGDVGTLAENLRDAFGATVVGLLVGTVAFGLTLTRTRMYTEDLAALEQGAEALVVGEGQAVVQRPQAAPGGSART